MQLADHAVDFGVCNGVGRGGVLGALAFVLPQTIEDDIAALVSILDQLVLEDVDEAARVADPVHDFVAQVHLFRDRVWDTLLELLLLVLFARVHVS